MSAPPYERIAAQKAAYEETMQPARRRHINEVRLAANAYERALQAAWDRLTASVAEALSAMNDAGQAQGE